MEWKLNIPTLKDTKKITNVKRFLSRMLDKPVQNLFLLTKKVSKNTRRIVSRKKNSHGGSTSTFGKKWTIDLAIFCKFGRGRIANFSTGVFH
jgi:hypothetical protein